MTFKLLQRAILLLVCISMAGCGGSESTPGNPVSVEQKPPQNTLVNCGTVSSAPHSIDTLQRGSLSVILGSSSAAGAGAQGYAFSWAGIYTNNQQLIGNSVQNIARGGDTTYHALPDYCVVSDSRPQPAFEHSVSKIFELKPRLVVISYPSNDAALGWSAAESVSNILLMRAKLSEQGIASIVIGAQPRTLDANKLAQLRRFNDDLRHFVAGCFVDVYANLELGGILNPRYDSGDGVHLNRDGHLLVYEKL